MNTNKLCRVGIQTINKNVAYHNFIPGQTPRASESISGIGLCGGNLQLFAGSGSIDTHPINMLYNLGHRKDYALAVAYRLYEKLDYQAPVWVGEVNALTITQALRELDSYREYAAKEAYRQTKCPIRYSGGERTEGGLLFALAINDTDRTIELFRGKQDALESIWTGDLAKLVADGQAGIAKVKADSDWNKDYCRAFNEARGALLDANLLNVWIRDRVAFMDDEERKNWVARVQREFAPTDEQVRARMAIHEQAEAALKAD